MIATYASRPTQSLLLIVFGAWMAGLAAADPASAQTPAPAQQQPVAIVGGTIHTVEQGTIDGGTVLFAEGKIITVGTDVQVPEDAEIIDATGKHVYPGFVHGRSILGLSEISRIQASRDIQELGDINPMIRAQVAFHSASEHLSVAAVHGITTAVPTPSGSLIAGMPAAMMTDGWTWEAMTVRERLGMAIEWPSMSNHGRYAEELKKLQEAFDKTRRYKKARTAQAGNAHQHPRDTRWEALLPVLNREMPVFLLVNDLRQIQAALAWAEQERFKPVLVGGRDIGLVADQLAQKEIPVMLRGVLSGPDRAWQGYDEGYQVARRLHEAGVMFCIVGDEEPAKAYQLAHHAAAAVAFGLPAEQGLKAITIHAAQILGVADVLGTLEPGKDATLVIADGHPLELWTTTERVFIRGRSLSMTDKHKRLYEHYLEKHRQRHAAPPSRSGS